MSGCFRPSTKKKDSSRAEEYYDQLLLYMTDLNERFDIFSSSCENMSEVCQYWEGFIEIVSILKALIAADREGDWQMHLQAMQNLLPVFRECDNVNYLRCASWYVEKMKKLPQGHPEIYEKFMQVHFVVKQNNREFNAVAPDMKLEQTIQRSKKRVKGIIGQTRQVAYVSQWGDCVS